VPVWSVHILDACKHQIVIDIGILFELASFCMSDVRKSFIIKYVYTDKEFDLTTGASSAVEIPADMTLYKHIHNT